MTDFSVEQQILYKLCSSQVRNYPFPHFFAEDVFPFDFYQCLLALMNRKNDFRCGKLAPGTRKFADVTSNFGLDFMKNPIFMEKVLKIFNKTQKYDVFPEMKVVRDSKGFSMEPHTDVPWKIMSLLFYLPSSHSVEKYGTSIYVPNDPELRCTTSRHYPFRKFKRAAMMPYRRNSCFGFWRTDQSFHGVEPVNDDFNRDTLWLQICDVEKYREPHV